MKNAVITGSTQGIGKSIALKLLEQGFFVILNYSHNEENANIVKTELDLDYPNQFKIIQSELSDYDNMMNFVSQCIDKVETVDYLILNAGITIRDKFEELTYEQWTEVMNTNLNIPFFLIQQFSKYMNKGGSILFISSILGEYPHSVSIPYGVSKAGVNALAKYLVKEFSDRTITVNAICPGFVNTIWQNTKSNDQRKKIEDKIALGRFANTEEIADVSYSVITNGYINGALIKIDGGYSFQ